MEKVIIQIFAVIVIFTIGYRMGFIACFKYLENELKEHKNEQSHGNCMGTNQKVG